MSMIMEMSNPATTPIMNHDDINDNNDDSEVSAADPVTSLSAMRHFNYRNKYIRSYSSSSSFNSVSSFGSGIGSDSSFLFV